jgi:hypothetical protein
MDDSIGGLRQGAESKGTLLARKPLFPPWFFWRDPQGAKPPFLACPCVCLSVRASVLRRGAPVPPVASSVGRETFVGKAGRGAERSGWLGGRESNFVGMFGVRGWLGPAAGGTGVLWSQLKIRLGAGPNGAGVGRWLGFGWLAWVSSPTPGLLNTLQLQLACCIRQSRAWPRWLVASPAP